ncbi:MAG TPA: hypothetical protein VGC06_11980, partial [Actinomycetes bacterium]
MSSRGHIARKQTGRGPRYYPVVELPRDPAPPALAPWQDLQEGGQRRVDPILGALDSGGYVEPSERTVSTFLLEDFLPGMRGKLEPNTHDVWTDYVR